MLRKLKQRLIDILKKYCTVIYPPDDPPMVDALYFNMPDEESAFTLARRGGDYLWALQDIAIELKSIRKHEDLEFLGKMKLTKKQREFVITIIDKFEDKFYSILADRKIDAYGEVE